MMMETKETIYRAENQELEKKFWENLEKAPKTMSEYLESAVKTYPDSPFVSKAMEEPMTYREYYNRVLTVADLLLSEGVMQQDKVAILGENSPNWSIAYFAIQKIGGVAVPILPDFPESDIRHILGDSEAKVLFTTQRQLEKIGDLDNTKVKSIITLDDFETDHLEVKSGSLPLKVETISGVVERARDFMKRIQETIGLKTREIKTGDTASIIYTSGTSGNSKAVMLSHRNFIANVTAMNLLIQLPPGSTSLSILPLSHVYEFTLGLLLPISFGGRIVYPGKAPTPSMLEKVCKVERPNVICAVPLILEKIYKKKVLPVLEKGTMVKVLTKIPGIKQKIYGKIRDKLLEFFGGRLEIMSIGGAPFNLEAEKFFRGCGFPYLIGYGLTETSPLLAGGPWLDKSIKISSTGKVTPGCEIKIMGADPKTGIGEVVARGPNVMKGYYNNPEVTKEVLDDDGWFKTGDLGRFDKNLNLYITGRSKNMILTANGENIFPESIEEKINAQLHVVESLVVENNSQLEAWVYLDYDLIDSETSGKSEKQRHDYIHQVLDGLRETVNQQMASFSKLVRMVEQKEPFVKTATQKIKRYLYSHNKDD